MSPLGPYLLVTVNNVPTRAKLVIGRFIETVKDRWTINLVGNAEGIDEVKGLCEKEKPDILFCASMWTKEESDEIQRIAKQTVPGIKTMAIPQGLQAEKGPDGVIEYLKGKWPGLVES